MKGIDVGSYCGKVDWQKAKKAGIEFAMIKATQGHGIGNPKLYLFTDGQFTYNMTECKRLNIPFGVYHYLTAVTPDEAKTEAEYFIKKISPYKSDMQLWAAVDVEDVYPARYCGKLDKQTLTNTTLAFIGCVREAGFKPMLYTNPNYLKYKYTSEKAFADIDIWLAHYGVKTPYQCNGLKIWQYGYTSVPGISTEVDGDIGYFDIAADADKPPPAEIEHDIPVEKPTSTETPKSDDLSNVSDTLPNMPPITPPQEPPRVVPEILPPVKNTQAMPHENGLYTPPIDVHKGAKNNKKVKRAAK